MTILLTAANGRTGRAVLTQLSKAGANAKVFLRDERQWPALQKLGAASYALGDMQDTSTINAAIASCETIIHIGPPMHPNEVEITSRFIDAALSHDISRFVYYSVMHPLRRAGPASPPKTGCRRNARRVRPALHHRPAHALHAAPGIDLEQGA